MNPLRKPVAEDALFPFELVYRDRKSPQRELPDHFHDRYELVYVYQGRGTFFIHRTFYEMKAGDLFLIPGNTIHRAMPDGDDPVLSTAAFFSPALVQPEPLGETYNGLYGFELARRRMHYKAELDGQHRALAEETLETMQRELNERKSGYRQAVRLQLLGLLLALNRLALSEQPGAAGGKPADTPWMKEVLLHIDRDCAEPGLGLAQLAELAAVTPSHLSRVFKRLTGMNVTDYIHAKRVIRAKELLLGTDRSVEQIAVLCGFPSPPYFYRVFKAIVGVTPRTYRLQR